MILSASRRTDIPAYYGEWLINRLKAGYALVRNPMNHAQISNVPLTPDVVDCIVFWTKDAHNFMPYLPILDKMGYPYYFQFTLTPYGADMEQNLRPKRAIVETFIQLSKTIGKERVIWRFDPIVWNNTLTLDYQKEQFSRLCTQLAPYTEEVVFSFVDSYKKIKSPLVRPVPDEEILALGKYIGETATAHGLTARTCCENVDLSAYGVQQGACIEQRQIEKVCGCKVAVPPDKNQRKGCRCVQSIDIGAYNTCPNGCVYCYASYSAASAAKNYMEHDPESEILLGPLPNSGNMPVRNVTSYRQMQLEL